MSFVEVLNNSSSQMTSSIVLSCSVLDIIDHLSNVIVLTSFHYVLTFINYMYYWLFVQKVLFFRHFPILNSYWNIYHGIMEPFYEIQVYTFDKASFQYMVYCISLSRSILCTLSNDNFDRSVMYRNNR